MQVSVTIDNDRQIDWIIPDGFDILMETAHKAIAQECSNSSQVIVIETIDGNISSTLISDVFAQTAELPSGIEASKMVCMWNTGEIDLPSNYLRKSLIELNPKNEETKILLNGGTKYIVRSLKTTI